MQRLKFWIGGALVGLVSLTGIAVAANGGASTETPSATFRAEDKRVLTRRCEGSDGTYSITRGVYVGEMESSDPRLDGKLRLMVHSVYNADEKVGWMRGTLHLRNADQDTRAVARLVAVNHDGTIEGMLTGNAGPRRVHLLANFVATFAANGFNDGKLGTAGSANQSLLFRAGCKRAEGENADERKAERSQKPERSHQPERGEKPTRPTP